MLVEIRPMEMENTENQTYHAKIHQHFNGRACVLLIDSGSETNRSYQKCHVPQSIIISYND